LLAGALARSGEDVLLLLQPERLTEYRGSVRIESVTLGRFEVSAAASTRLEREIDVLWVVTKAWQLDEAFRRAEPMQVGDALVVPLLNGIDHMRLLRGRYRRVAAASIRVESHRVSDWTFRHSSEFLDIDLCTNDQLIGEVLCRAGIDHSFLEDEVSLLWDKLVRAAPIALVTSALGSAVGEARRDPRFAQCLGESITVARAEGARIDAEAVTRFHEAVPAEMRSSLQRDLAAGRATDLDAIAGPILRAGTRHGIDAPVTRELHARVRAAIAR